MSIEQEVINLLNYQDIDSDHWINPQRVYNEEKQAIIAQRKADRAAKRAQKEAAKAQKEAQKKMKKTTSKWGR